MGDRKQGINKCWPKIEYHNTHKDLGFTVSSDMHEMVPSLHDDNTLLQILGSNKTYVLVPVSTIIHYS